MSNTEESHYVNKIAEDDNLQSISSGLPEVVFELQPSDLSQPWFHKRVDRNIATFLLKKKQEGTFLIRPSSMKSCYACTWVTEGKKIKHEAIYPQYPGYSLIARPTQKEIFPTLTKLVECLRHLQHPLPAMEENAEACNKRMKQTSIELVKKIVEIVSENVNNLTSITWKLQISENSRILDECEKRTIVQYCDVEYVAPDLLPLGEKGTDFFKAITRNKTLVGLCIQGYYNHTFQRFQKNISDDQIPSLCQSLKFNQTLTHLDLSSNEISDEGAILLAQAFSINQTLVKINLENNFIHIDGISALARCLLRNCSISELKLDPQLHVNKITGTGLNIDIQFRNIHFLIKQSLLRKKELQLSSSHPRNNIPFFGFLTDEEIQKKLIPPASQSQGASQFIFYVKKQVANTLFVATMNKKNQIIEKAIFRDDFGYSFSPTTNHRGVPSLFEYCGWFCVSNKSLLNELKQIEHYETKLKLRQIELLKPLWGIAPLPSKEYLLKTNSPVPSKTVWPTLSSLLSYLQKNPL